MPSLKERIDADLKDAMRSKDELGTSVLRMLKSAVKYKEVEPGGHALEDGGVLAVIQTLIKQRRDSVEQFRAGGRPELADKEEREIAQLQSLPAGADVPRRAPGRGAVGDRPGGREGTEGHGRGDEGAACPRSRAAPRARRSPRR